MLTKPMPAAPEEERRQFCQSQLGLMLRSSELLGRYIALVGRGEVAEAHRLMGLIRRLRERREGYSPE